LKARKVIASKLVEKVGNLFWEVEQLAVLAKPYLVGAYHLLPLHRPPANVVVTSSSKFVGDLTPPQSTGPDITADAQTAALVQIITLPHIHPPPISSQGGLCHCTTIMRFLLPVIHFKALITIVDSRCNMIPDQIHYHIIVYYNVFIFYYYLFIF
jgi:hypothetical protein